MRRVAALLGLALLAGCGDDVQGQLRLLVVPHHQGRNPVQDPFALVERVEVGLTGEDGVFRPLGEGAPLHRFGPGLLSPGAQGAPTLLGYNERGREVSLGFGLPVALRTGQDESRSVALVRLDHAVARPLGPVAGELADPFAGQAPALRLGEQQLESGALDSDDDAGALVWALWGPDGLRLKLRVRDDQVQAAPADQAISAGDGLRVYLDGLADGLAGGADDLVISVGADGRVEPAAGAQAAIVPWAGGYEVSLSLPLPAPAKNGGVGFDVRVWDLDAGGAPSVLTWVFDPRTPGAEPSPAGYGRLVLAPALLDLLPRGQGPSARASLAGRDGLVALDGAWDELGLTLAVDVPDDAVQTAGGGEELTGADRVELWLDLANGLPPALERHRFVRLLASAGGQAVLAAGPAPGAIDTGGVAFTGQVVGAAHAGGYLIEAYLPWADLGLEAGAQRDWFLGLEVLVQDEDPGGAQGAGWSADPARPELWNELRLFDLE
ncbi:MAG TPA: hypothetical protein PK668_00440 [Myxococcota bacterium]|nr:hypothetical protein [Myxococcota bacterium]HRY95701.1 hypothetical protein [Myxococcota bacterium]HSA20183.1 hypothetical protein [Myxococcota bacterium]